MAPISVTTVLASGDLPSSLSKHPRKQTLAARLRANSYSSHSEESSYMGSETDSEVSETDSTKVSEKRSTPLQGTSLTKSRLTKQTTSQDTVESVDKIYACAHAGCEKSYRKPSRLQEHERSHTGERPFVCPECGKSFLRDSHLRAHSRSHLPASARPFVCTYEMVVADPKPRESELIPTQTQIQSSSLATTQSQVCGQRFWTAQHLRSHELLIHHGEKPYKCTLCPLAFSKHGALRLHIADSHSPPGTKSYRCEHVGCTQSFATNQKLKSHAKVHDVTRYACAHPNCSNNTSTTIHFPSWSLLQEHMRSAHPPTCPYPACNGRTFTSSKGLRGHIKTHRDRELEAEYLARSEISHKRSHVETDPVNEASGPPLKRRRGGETGRDWPCPSDKCDKSFKSKKAQQDHIRVNHEGLRKFTCPRNGCGQTFGYKHVMQRHLERHHRPQDDLLASPQPVSTDQKAIEKQQIIDLITGQDYDVSPSSSKSNAVRSINCPWPDGFDTRKLEDKEHTQAKCAYKFNRAYDLRRHLRSAHGLDIDADEVSTWVLEHKRTHPSEKTD